MKKSIGVVVLCCLLSTSILVGCGTTPSSNESINTNSESSVDEPTSDQNIADAKEIEVGSVAYDGEEGTVTVTDLYHGRTEYGIGYVIEYEYKNNSDKEIDCYFGDSYLNDRRIGTQHPKGFDIAPGKIGDTYCVIFDSDITDKMESFEVIETNVQFAYVDADDEFSSYPVIIKKSSFTEKMDNTSSSTNNKTNTETTDTETTKTEKNGWSEETNKKFEFGSYSIEAPSYFTETIDNEFIFFKADNDDLSITVIPTDNEDMKNNIENDTVTDEWINSYCDESEDSIKNQEINKDKEYEVVESHIDKIEGIENAKICNRNLMVTEEGKKELVIYYYIFDCNNNKIIFFLAETADDSKYDYSEDVKKVAYSIATNDSSKASGVSTDFKDMLDAYEEFMDEYIEFMKLYNQNPTDTELMSQYMEIMTKYSEYATTISKLDESEMTDEEAAYYLEVTGRVTQKLLEAGLSQ